MNIWTSYALDKNTLFEILNASHVIATKAMRYTLMGTIKNYPFA
jgi:hypothetical protein